MNITTFNDAFERPFTETEGGKHWSLMNRSPLFVHEMDYVESMHKFSGAKNHVSTQLPYKMLRLNMTLLQDHSKLRSEERYLIDTTRNGFMVYHYIAKYSASSAGPGGKADGVMRFGFEEDFEGVDYHSQAFWVFGENRWTPMPEYIRRIAIDPGIIKIGSNDPVKLVREMTLASIALIGVFAMDVMAPTSHIAQVSPDRPGKSVQWVEQRTHYTLIHHGHPANSKTVSEGESISVDRKEELTRMAHGRRAHKRTLRSDRFRYAKGKTIDVRECWVGPKEWKELGSKQIYRILEPVV